MDQRRLELQAKLKDIAPNVYFQPPPSQQMAYPCIVYERYQDDAKFANNQPYRNTTRYQVTVIDADPDGPIRPAVRALPMCLFNRYFKADNLNHDVFDLYY